ncbi:FixH family protein [Permianibacter sp. IMCC34836]|uniref:FixH family protein n=1 Tax=Permianibacter fluminis TaxID=2738515 RepID=UPI001553992D|nr:FixH family protein [Permianibacter fluminis]NQD37909.1 FixH family protein [Permianibacter fluminis]
MSKLQTQENGAAVMQDAQPVNWLKLPWLLLWLLPALAVVAGLTTVYIAVRYGDSMVKDDYYKQGLAYNVQQQADRQAADLHLRAMLVPVNSQWLLTLSAEKMPVLPEVLLLQLSHPTDKSVDQQITFTRQSGQQYAATVSALVETNWYVQLHPEDDSWRLRGRWQSGAAAQLQPEIL